MASNESGRYVVVELTAAPPPEDPFVQDLADAFWRIEGNWYREGTGPGSRFEGLTLERALAEYAIREVRRHYGRLRSIPSGGDSDG